jgi:hypothetical protein
VAFLFFGEERLVPVLRKRSGLSEDQWWVSGGNIEVNGAARAAFAFRVTISSADEHVVETFDRTPTTSCFHHIIGCCSSDALPG